MSMPANIKRTLKRSNGSTDCIPILPATEAEAQSIENMRPVITKYVVLCKEADFMQVDKMNMNVNS